MVGFPFGFFEDGADDRDEKKDESDIEEQMVDMKKQRIPGYGLVRGHVVRFRTDPQQDEYALQDEPAETEQCADDTRGGKKICAVQPRLDCESFPHIRRLLALRWRRQEC